MSKWITIRYHKAGSTFSSVDESRLQQYTDLQNVKTTSDVSQLISLGTGNGSIIATPTLLANGSGHQTNLVFSDYIINNIEPVRLFVKDPDAYFANTTIFPESNTAAFSLYANNNGQKVYSGFSEAGWTITIVDRNY